MDTQVTNPSRLHATGLAKAYKGVRVVDDVDIEVVQGEIVGLLGPNGAGKTTTFYMIVGLIPPLAGSVHLDDEDLTKTPMFRRARKGMGYLAQEPSVFRRLSVEDNGPGIAEDERERVFEKFHQLARGGVRGRPRGSGLGLPISRGIVAQLGGRLWVEDAVTLGGAALVMELPAAPEAGPPAAEPARR